MRELPSPNLANHRNLRIVTSITCIQVMVIVCYNDDSDFFSSALIHNFELAQKLGRLSWGRDQPRSQDLAMTLGPGREDKEEVLRTRLGHDFMKCCC